MAKRRAKGTVFKRGGTGVYYGAFYLPTGKRRQVKLFSDRQASELELDRLIKKEERTFAGLELPEDQQIPVDALLREYLDHCRYLDQNPRHIAIKEGYLRRVIDVCQATLLTDITVPRVQALLVTLREQGLGARTRNLHVIHLRAWVRWVAIHRGVFTPQRFESIPRASEKRDTRRVRRALSREEIRRLLESAQLRPIAELGRPSIRRTGSEANGRKGWCKQQLDYASLQACYDRGLELLVSDETRFKELRVLGQHRADVYRFLIFTGCRVGETRQLIWNDIDLARRCVRLRAEVTKNANADEVPLVDSVVAMLKRRSQSADQRQPVFPIMPSIRVFDRDLRSASIEKRDLAGRVVDLHALRTTCGTLLANSGVAPQIASRILRHSSISLTMNHYTRLQLDDSARAIVGIDGF